MIKEALFLGPYLTHRMREDHDVQRIYRTDSDSDLIHWGFNGDRYRLGFRKNEWVTTGREVYLTPVEDVMMQHINHLLTVEETVTVMDYGAVAARTLKRLSRIFEGNERVIFFATSLSETPTDAFLDGIDPGNPQIHYIPGDITDVLTHQRQILADGREISLTNGIDIFVSDHAISHSLVPGIVLSQLPLILNSNSLVILGNKGSRFIDPMYDKHSKNQLQHGAFGKARTQEWYSGMDYLEKSGYRLLASDPYDYNYLVFAGSCVTDITIP